MRRRRLALIIALLLALPLAATAARGEEAPDPITHVDLLAPSAGSRLAAAQQDSSVLQRALPTEGAAIIGLAWTTAGADAPTAAVRFHTVDGWDMWTDVEVEDSGTGPATSDGMIAVGADTVEVRITGLDTAPLDSAELMLVDAPSGPTPVSTPTASGVVEPSSSGSTTTPLLTAAVVAPPALITRAQWGANETPPSADCVTPNYAVKLERFVIHHTAGTNSYWGGDSAAIIRAIQQYHVGGRGWCDVGYNFLVDKYGQMFEGRRGGVDRLVVGVHASGHNTGGVGISVLGNYVSIPPPEAAVNAIVHIVGWKSYLHGFDPAAGSVKNGVWLPHVIGHRDVAQTSCPGSFWNRLAEIATRGRALSLEYTPAISGASGITGPVFRNGATVVAGIPVPAETRYTFRNGSGTVLAALTRDVIPVGSTSQPWNGNLAGTDTYAPTGTYAVAIGATSTLGKPMSAATAVTLSYPTNFVAADAPGVLNLPATGGGDSHELSVADDLGITAGGDVARLVMRVCGDGGTTTVTPTGLTHGHEIDLAAVPGGCGLLAVPMGESDTVDVVRSAGSGTVTVDGLGYLSSAIPQNTFWDVTPTVLFHDEIQWIYAAGITNGQGDGSYRSAWPVERQAMAAFLYRAAGFPTFVPPAEPTFADVPPNHMFYREIEWMAAEGITRGTVLPSGEWGFSTLEPLSRQAMAAFLFRMSGDPVPASTPGQGPFPDVPDGAPFEDEIRWMSETGITLGNGDGTYQPLAQVRRDAMAAFLQRSSGLL